MESANYEATTEELITRLFIGAILGTILTTIVGMIGWSLYALGLTFFVICLFQPLFWLLLTIEHTGGMTSWIPLGALAGATYALYRLHRSKGVPRSLLYSTGGVLFTVGLIFLVFRLLPPGQVDRTAIAARYTELYESYNNGQYEQAYRIMSPTYRETHNVEQFKSDFSLLAGTDGEQLEPDHSIRRFNNRAYLCPAGQRWSLGLLWSGYEFELEKVGGLWYFTGEYEFVLD